MTKEEIKEVFEKAGVLLNCDSIKVFDLKENENKYTGVCKILYNIDVPDNLEMFSQRVYDMVCMGLWGYGVNFTGLVYNNNGVFTIVFEIDRFITF